MKKGITANSLKIIAVIIMILDHVFAYVHYDYGNETYYLFRSIGRIAMPIFTYLIVQGFFYTKDLRKYIFRIFSIATLTQIILVIMGYINQKYFPNYWIGVNNYLGILYSYTFSLIMLMAIDKKVIIKKLNENQNLFIRINMILLIILIYSKLKIEFDMQIPFLMLEIYGIEKMFEANGKLLLNNNPKIGKKLIYIALIIISIILSTFFLNYSSGCKYASVLATLFIAFYNGKRGNNSKFVKYMYYMIFPIQHFILYFIGMNLKF